MGQRPTHQAYFICPIKACDSHDLANSTKKPQQLNSGSKWKLTTAVTLCHAAASRTLAQQLGEEGNPEVLPGVCMHLWELPKATLNSNSKRLHLNYKQAACTTRAVTKSTARYRDRHTVWTEHDRHSARVYKGLPQVTCCTQGRRHYPPGQKRVSGDSAACGQQVSLQHNAESTCSPPQTSNQPQLHGPTKGTLGHPCVHT